MRLETLGVVDFLVAEPGLAKDFGFEGELDKFVRPFALDHDFWALFVNGDSEFVFLGVEKGVGLGREYPVLPFEDGFELRSACGAVSGEV